MERKLTCIICPRGCAMTVSGEENDLRVEGNSCPNGEKYAISEVTNPVRTVTSIVRVANRTNTMVSVKTAAPVPKGNMNDVIDALRKLTVNAPVAIGDVLISNIFGTQVIATKDIM